MKKMRIASAAAVVLLITPFASAISNQEVQSATPVVIERIADEGPSRSAQRSEPTTTLPIEAVVPPEGFEMITYDTPTTTTTTAAPTTTTTAAPKPRVTTTTAAVAEEAAPAPVSGSVVDIAIAQTGKAYRSGATGPNAFDCSGLVYYVFNQAGISIPRMSSDGYFAAYPHVSRAELQPGDLVVYPGHIAIYVGGGQIVSASTPKGGVKHYGMENPGRILGYARIS